MVRICVVNFQLGPCANEAHEECTKEYQKASNNAALTTQVAPALVTEKVLGEQFDERCKGQEASGDGVHDTHENEANL